MKTKNNLSSGFTVSGTTIKGVYAIYDAGLEKTEDVAKREFSSFGKTVFSEEELDKLENFNVEQIILWLEEKNKLIEPLELQMV